MHKRRPMHLAGFPYVGPHRYHLRWSTDTRRPLFADGAVVDLVLAQIQHQARLEEFAVVAYCFMPDHLHLLIQGETDAADCRRFIARTKQASGYAHSKRFHERLWQRYGFERVLRDNEDTVSVAAYILRNPLRGGLAMSPLDYPFCGSLAYPIETLLRV